MSEILDKKISYFNSTLSIKVKGELTILEMLEEFESGEHLDLITRYRNGDKEAKKFLPTFAAHGIFKDSRKKENFQEASGVIILDIDNVDVDRIEDIKGEIFNQSDSILAVMVSPSGTGIKVLYLVESETIFTDNYRQIGKQIVQEFSHYGDVDYLSITDCLIATYDPDILISLEAIPDHVIIVEQNEFLGEIEKRDETKNLFDDAQEFFDKVLYDSILSNTNNNFHFIQVSILDLKKYGFQHPDQDLSFVIEYAESNFKTSSANKGRFNSVVELSKQYPQLKWPYKFGSKKSNDDDEAWAFDDEFVDYSMMGTVQTETELLQSSKKNSDRLKESIEQLEGEDKEFDGLVDYSGLWSKMMETMALGDRVGYEISLSNFADVFRTKGTGILVVTGIPTHGKTEFVDQITLDLARLHGHQTLVAGFEQEEDEHIIKLIRKMVGVDVRHVSYRSNEKNLPVIKSNYEFIIDHFKHINVRKIGSDITKILEHSASIINAQRAAGKNPRYLVIDPFNMLSIKTRSSSHEKVEEILRQMNNFSHQMDIMIILVAHPTKMKKDEKTKEYDVPDFYSVKGSSAFFEMAYHGLTVYRNTDGSVMVKVLKVKQNNLGRRDAEVFFFYDVPSGRYIPINEDCVELEGDHRELNWLEKIEKK